MVRSHQGLIIPKINLVLPGSKLMIGRFHIKAHLLQRQDNIPSRILSQIDRAHIKKARFLMGKGRGISLIIRVEQEKLTLRPHVELVSQSFRVLHCPLQDPAGIAAVDRSVRSVNIADQPGHLPLLGPPREHSQGIQIRAQEHIHVVVMQEALHAGAVEYIALIQHPLQLPRGHRRVFQVPEQIHELQTDEFHILFFHHSQNIAFRIMAHNNLLQNTL